MKELKQWKKEDWSWIHEPQEYQIEDNKIVIVTQPHTDYWQRTYYGMQNDNAPTLQVKTAEEYFTFVVRTDFDSHYEYDQCGIIMYHDSDNWMKASIEYETDSVQKLGSVVTNHGYSDWATTDISADVKSMYYRFSRRKDDFCIEYSQDGKNYTQMRVFHFFEGSGEIQFGVYACSPSDSSFTATFTEMSFTECIWDLE
jgi:regulation of enolase protein 1 (concanavalin A-like superfamily)